MKCRECGNDDVFYEAYLTWDKVYYGGTLDIQDSKGLDCQGADEYPRECADCKSTNIDEEN